MQRHRYIPNPSETRPIDNAPNSAKMEHVKIIPRTIESRLRQALGRQKSVLLLGPRQTGKTTLVEAL